MKVLFIALTALCMTACATPTPRSEPKPIEAFQAYQQSLVNGDLRSAYGFLGQEAKKSLSLKAFERLYEKHGDAMKLEAAKVLERLREQSPLEEVWISVGKHQAHLVRTKSGWRLTGVLGTVPHGEEAPKE